MPNFICPAAIFPQTGEGCNGHIFNGLFLCGKEEGRENTIIQEPPVGQPIKNVSWPSLFYPMLFCTHTNDNRQIYIVSLINICYLFLHLRRSGQPRAVAIHKLLSSPPMSQQHWQGHLLPQIPLRICLFWLEEHAWYPWGEVSPQRRHLEDDDFL